VLNMHKEAPFFSALEEAIEKNTKISVEMQK
jgi:hypothetical protein